MRWDWGIEEHDETWNYRTSVNDADFDANSKHAAWALGGSYISESQFPISNKHETNDVYFMRLL